jgi:hypothetical protein
MNFFKLTLALISAAALTACGGGGGDSTTPASPGQNPNNPTSPTTVVPNANALALFAGVWQEPCAASDFSVDTSTEAPTNNTSQVELTVSNGQLVGTTKYVIYAYTDFSCKNAPLTTLTQVTKFVSRAGGAGASYDGVANASFDADLTLEPLIPGKTGATVQVGSISFNNTDDKLTATKTYQTILKAALATAPQNDVLSADGILLGYVRPGTKK